MNFFILGNPRSGTSLLRLILNTHSLIGVPPESGFLHWWYEKYKNWSAADSINQLKVLEFVKDLLSSKKIEGWNLDEHQLILFINQNQPKNYLELITSIYKLYTQKPIVGDKNNYYIKHLDEIEIIAQNPKYIHLIRDGRDVACSYLKIKELDQSSFVYLPSVSYDINDIAIEWNNNISQIEDFILDKDSISIKYEDLINFPQDTICKICRFLNVNFEENMLNYYLNNDEPLITSAWKQKTFESIDSTNKGKYKSILSKNELEKFNRIASKNLLKFKYDI